MTSLGSLFEDLTPIMLRNFLLISRLNFLIAVFNPFVLMHVLISFSVSFSLSTDVLGSSHLL